MNSPGLTRGASPRLRRRRLRSLHTEETRPCAHCAEEKTTAQTGGLAASPAPSGVCVSGCVSGRRLKHKPVCDPGLFLATAANDATAASRFRIVSPGKIPRSQTAETKGWGHFRFGMHVAKLPSKNVSRPTLPWGGPSAGSRSPETACDGGCAPSDTLG